MGEDAADTEVEFDSGSGTWLPTTGWGRLGRVLDAVIMSLTVLRQVLGILGNF